MVAGSGLGGQVILLQYYNSGFGCVCMQLVILRCILPPLRSVLLRHKLSFSHPNPRQAVSGLDPLLATFPGLKKHVYIQDIIINKSLLTKHIQILDQ